MIELVIEHIVGERPLYQLVTHEIAVRQHFPVRLFEWSISSLLRLINKFWRMLKREHHFTPGYVEHRI